MFSINALVFIKFPGFIMSRRKRVAADEDDEADPIWDDTNFRISGFIRNDLSKNEQHPEAAPVQQWDPCMMVVKDNRLSVYLGSVHDDSACCSMEVDRAMWEGRGCF